MNIEDAKQLIAYALYDQKPGFREDKIRVYGSNIRYEVVVKVDLVVVFKQACEVTPEMAINNDQYYYDTLYMQMLMEIIKAGVAAATSQLEAAPKPDKSFYAGGKWYREGDSFDYNRVPYRILALAPGVVHAMGIYPGAMAHFFNLEPIIYDIEKNATRTTSTPNQ